MSANSPYKAIAAANIAKISLRSIKIRREYLHLWNFYIMRFLCLLFMAKSKVPKRTGAHALEVKDKQSEIATSKVSTFNVRGIRDKILSLPNHYNLLDYDDAIKPPYQSPLKDYFDTVVTLIHRLA